MTVWLVMEGTDDGCYVKAIFLEEKKADAFCDKLIAEDKTIMPHYYWTEEHEVLE